MKYPMNNQNGKQSSQSEQSSQSTQSYLCRSFLLIVKEKNEQAYELAKNIKAWLEEKKLSATIIPAFLPEEQLLEYTPNHDLAIVLGGDGTILGVSRRMYKKPLPLIGINFGKVGFLADISPEKWKECLTKLLAGEYNVHKVTPLHFDHFRDDKIIHSGIAMNDVVISRGAVAKSIFIKLAIDDIFITDLHCDGLICSSPLGTTAYTASAHGPLTFPTLDAHILTPISPFAGSFSPLVMPKESTIKIKCLEDRETFITVDGQDSHAVLMNDIICVKSAEHKISLLVSDTRWFWKRLRERGFILPGPGKYTVS